MKKDCTSVFINGVPCLREQSFPDLEYQSLSTEFRASLASGRENKALAGGGRGAACLLTHFL